MHELPHFYSVTVDASAHDTLRCNTGNLPELVVAPPTQFDGPGDQWSPEELLMAAVANCFVLSFRTVADIAKLEWESIQCQAQGELDKVARTMLFTTITTKVKLQLKDIDSKSKAETLLKKAEKICIVSNSLSAEKHLEIEIVDS
ncbi:OsmC family protein [Zhongshania guokunii]|uniref:OsmC family protein n=1 Tax=Zhongshania guokunii TaxID=641783 RepID=A0ABV3U848_9GAMM